MSATKKGKLTTTHMLDAKCHDSEDNLLIIMQAFYYGFNCTNIII